jgi:hypothetical protein
MLKSKVLTFVVSPNMAERNPSGKGSERGKSAVITADTVHFGYPIIHSDFVSRQHYGFPFSCLNHPMQNVPAYFGRNRSNAAPCHVVASAKTDGPCSMSKTPFLQKRTQNPPGFIGDLEKNEPKSGPLCSENINENRTFRLFLPLLHRRWRRGLGRGGVYNFLSILFD